MDDFESAEELAKYGRKPWGTCRAQAVRSVSDWSHGVLTEHSIQNACEFAFEPEKEECTLKDIYRY